QNDLSNQFAELMLGCDATLDLDEQLFDNPESTAPFYSVLDDHRNPFHKHEHTLLDHVFSSPELHRRFVKRDGDLNQPAARAYLQQLEDFELPLMLTSDSSGGGNPRTTEITQVLVCNTPFRSRNLLCVGKNLCIVRAYNKTSALRDGADVIVPTGVDAFSANLILR